MTQQVVLTNKEAKQIELSCFRENVRIKEFCFEDIEERVLEMKNERNYEEEMVVTTIIEPGSSIGCWFWSGYWLFRHLAFATHRVKNEAGELCRYPDSLPFLSDSSVLSISSSSSEEVCRVEVDFGQFSTSSMTDWIADFKAGIRSVKYSNRDEVVFYVSQREKIRPVLVWGLGCCSHSLHRVVDEVRLS